MVEPADVNAVVRMVGDARAGGDRTTRASGRRVAWRSAIGDSRSSTCPTRARSPWSTATLGLSLVFNGCIYNHQQLRAELERDGYRFFSHSDTEVILKAYARWGIDCVDHFVGMFAFAV